MTTTTLPKPMTERDWWLMRAKGVGTTAQMSGMDVVRGEDGIWVKAEDTTAEWRARDWAHRQSHAAAAAAFASQLKECARPYEELRAWFKQ